MGCDLEASAERRPDQTSEWRAFAGGEARLPLTDGTERRRGEGRWERETEGRVEWVLTRSLDAPGGGRRAGGEAEAEAWSDDGQLLLGGAGAVAGAGAGARVCAGAEEGRGRRRCCSAGFSAGSKSRQAAG